TRLKENLQIFDLDKDRLPTSSQQALSRLSELAMLLGISDTTLPSFQQGFSQLHLDALKYFHVQKNNQLQLNTIEEHQQEAKQGLDRLLKLKQRLIKQRETKGDIEQRVWRRSTELSRIQINENIRLLEQILNTQRENGLVDVETQGLTIAQLENQQNMIHGLEQQLKVQGKTLTAYQDIPP
ncbi:hypothetical protein BX616_008160, partial [Lobosporangium transversale]